MTDALDGVDDQLQQKQADGVVDGYTPECLGSHALKCESQVICKMGTFRFPHTSNSCAMASSSMLGMQRFNLAAMTASILDGPTNAEFETWYFIDCFGRRIAMSSECLTPHAGTIILHVRIQMFIALICILYTYIVSIYIYIDICVCICGMQG